jgi:hypothetical protein
MISIILDILHGGFLFVPLGLIFVPQTYVSFKLYHLLLLLYTLVPIHWYYLNGQCIITYITQKMGGLKNAQTSSPFSEKWLWWFYNPMMDLLDYEYTSDNLNIMIYNYAVFNILLMWGLVYYKAEAISM